MSQHFDANISYAFYFSATGFASQQAFAQAMRQAIPDAVEYGYDATYTQGYMQDLQTVQRFLHGGAQTYAVKRFFLEGLRPDLQRAGFDGWCVMVSYFPETDIMSLSFHYSLKSVSMDHLIVLRQSGVYRPYPFQDREVSCADLAREFCQRLQMPFRPAEQSFVCEVTRFGEYTDIECIERERASELYGLLSGDEAYEFVPEEIARARISRHWGSRCFTRIYAFGPSFLFLNLLDTDMHRRYLDHQETFGKAAYGGCDPYFHLGSCPLTVNHGILFAIEFVMLLKTLVNDVMAYQAEYDRKEQKSFYQRIRETRRFRKKIITVLEKVESTEISEIGELSGMLLESQHIAPIVDRVKYLLELLEGDLDLMYSERNNTLMTALTILGLVFAALQIVLPMLPV